MVDNARPTRPQVSESETSYHTGDLDAFARVVDSGSITAAARELGETKGSVSRRVTRLERQVGAPLLSRTGRAVTPTDAGRAFRSAVGRALDALGDARAAVHGLSAEPTGHLRVTAPLGFGTLLLAPRLGAFLDRHPHLTVDLRLTEAVLSFTEHRIDAALRLSAALPDSALVARRLLTLHGTLVASPDYLARHGTPASPADLDRHRLLVPPVAGPAISLRLAPLADPTRGRDVRLRGTVLSHDLLFLQEAAIGGAGVALLPAGLGSHALSSGRLVPVLPAWKVMSDVGLWLLHLPGPVPPKLAALRAWIEEISQEIGACPGAAGPG